MNPVLQQGTVKAGGAWPRQKLWHLIDFMPCVTAVIQIKGQATCY